MLLRAGGACPSPSVAPPSSGMSMLDGASSRLRRRLLLRTRARRMPRVKSSGRSSSSSSSRRGSRGTRCGRAPPPPAASCAAPPSSAASSSTTNTMHGHHLAQQRLAAHSQTAGHHAAAAQRLTVRPQLPQARPPPEFIRACGTAAGGSSTPISRGGTSQRHTVRRITGRPLCPSWITATAASAGAVRQ